MDKIMQKLDVLIQQNNKILYELEQCKKSGENMDRHISRIESIYQVFLQPIKRVFTGEERHQLDDIV